MDVTSWSLGTEPDTLTFSCFRRGRHVVVGADLNTILTLAERCYVMEKGQIVDQIGPGDVSQDSVRRHLLL